MKVEDVPEEYQHAVVAAYIALGTAPGGPDEIDIPSHNDVAFILAAVIPAIQNEALERAAVERLRGALERIADDITVIEDAANPDNWPANVARAALALAVAEGGGPQRVRDAFGAYRTGGCTYEECWTEICATLAGRVTL